MDLRAGLAFAFDSDLDLVPLSAPDLAAPDLAAPRLAVVDLDVLLGSELLRLREPFSFDESFFVRRPVDDDDSFLRVALRLTPGLAPPLLAALPRLGLE